MKVRNVHERELPASERAAALIDSLGSKHDALWPRGSWPRLVLDRAPSVGASGGHGPIRYFVEQYVPGESIKFRFTRPKGFQGYHRYDMVKAGSEVVVLRHTLEMTTRGLAVLSWPLVFRPLHDALIEDSLATAETALGGTPRVRPWSLWVRLLRRIMSRGRAPRQQVTRVSEGDRAADDGFNPADAVSR